MLAVIGNPHRTLDCTFSWVWLPIGAAGSLSLESLVCQRVRWKDLGDFIIRLDRTERFLRNHIKPEGVIFTVST